MKIFIKGCSTAKTRPVTDNSASYRKIPGIFTVVFAVMMLSSFLSLGQTTNDYRTVVATPVNLDASTNWERWNGSAWVAAVAAPIGVVASGNTITILATATYSGSLTPVSIISGVTLLHQGLTAATMSAGLVTINGIFVHNTTSSFSRIIAASAFSAISTCEFRGSSILVPATSFSGRTFGNILLSSTSGALTISGTGAAALIINGNLTVGPGVTFNLGLTASPGHSIKGNIAVSAGATLNFNPASAGTLNFNGTSAQTITNSGTLTFAANQAVVIFNTGSPTPTVTFNQSQTIAGSMTVNSVSILATSGTLTLSGTPSIPGSFQVNQGGFATGGTWNYGATGTLIFNNSSGSYGVNNDAYWPSTNGPINVNVLGAGGITMNVTRAVSGLFQASAGVTNANNLTLNGTGKINAGGFFAAIPVWGAASTLVYNSGGTYGRNNEFPNAGTLPANVQVSGNTTLNYPNGGLAARILNGDLTIDAGSAFYMDYGSPSPGVGLLTINNLFLNGNISLGNQVSGDLAVKGNFTRTGIFTPNNRAVFFTAASGDQAITGATSFDFVIVDKAAGKLVLASSITCNQTLTLTNGIIDARTNAQSLIANSTVVRTNGWVNGNLQLAVGTGAPVSKDFYIGDATNYTPVNINFASVTTAGNLTGISNPVEDPAIATSDLDDQKSVNRYWAVTNSGIVFTTYDATFNFVAGDKDAGVTTSTFLVGKYNGATWSYPNVGTLTATSSQLTGASGFSDFAIAERGKYYWTGATNTVWSTATNWSTSVAPVAPAVNKNIIIPGSLTNYPVLDINPSIKNLDMASGATLSINGQTIAINGAVTGAGSLTGSTTSILTIGGAAGTLNFTGGADSLNNLNLNSNSSATLGTTLDIFGTITLTAGASTALHLASRNLTLKSTSSNTARIADLTGSILDGADNVTVERYIPATGRRFRLLAPTVTTTGSINTNWMEGGMNNVAGTNINTVPGYGTQITGTGGNSNGFDVSISNAPSFYGCANGAIPSYSAFAGTSATLNPLKGYFLFIRGDRSMDMTLFNTNVLPMPVPLPSSSTTLRATGTILQGTQTSFDNPFSAGELNLVTNPFPSPIDWALVQPACTNVTPFYTLWDASIGYRGGFVTVSTSGIKSDITSNATTVIQPGQAFFVQSTGGVPIVGIQESHKVAGNNNGIFSAQAEPQQQFSISLYYKEGNGLRRLADAVTAVYGKNYSRAVNAEDAKEVPNWDENIAIAREGSHLAIEARPLFVWTDTLPLFMERMKETTYEFQFMGSDFVNAVTEAFLIDKFTGQRTLLSVSGATVVPIRVTADAGSSATDRFMVVFGKSDPKPNGVGNSGGNPSVHIYPNPVTGNSFKLEVKNLAKGTYKVALINQAGQQVFFTTLIHNGGSATEHINLKNNLPAGIYELQVSGGGVKMSSRMSRK